MARQNKPYSRDARPHKGNSDGAWTHDLHQSTHPSLASRLTGSSGPSKAGQSLLDRINGGKGKELLPAEGSGSKLHGFGDKPPINPSNANAGVELLPSNSAAGPSRNRRGAGSTSKGRLVDSGINAALGVREPRRSNVRAVSGGTAARNGGRGVELLGYDGHGHDSRRPPVWDEPARTSVDSPSTGVSIMGASRGVTWVRVENLAQGTTTTDVIHAFAPAPISNARTTSSPSAVLVTIEIELESLSAAEAIVAQYNGVVADGNALAVSIIQPARGLADRLGRHGARSSPAQAPTPVQSYAQPARQELVVPLSSSKLYSDTILAADPSASIITLAQQDEQARAAARARAGAWKGQAPAVPSLAQRVGVARR